MRRIFSKYPDLPTRYRKTIWRLWHRAMLLMDKDQTRNVTFMNFGYQSLDESERLALEKEDEKNRYCIQLYDHVADASPLQKSRVLEVGSGRGGGAAWLSRRYEPASYTALDISGGVISFCNRYHSVPGLSFVKGIAESLPFGDHSFDFVINIESARGYNNIKRFFSEVHRVLHPEGCFHFADMIYTEQVETMHQHLRDCGFEIRRSQNISPNVVKAIELDHARVQALIQRKAPRFLWGSFVEFSGTQGSDRHRTLKEGSLEYWSFTLSKA